MGATGAAGSARHDIGMTMGAVGARGSLLKPPDKNGLEVALKTDTFWVGMDLDSATGPRITDADASRTRLLLEAACDCRYAWGGGLVGGSVDFGIRRDAGAAETGMGLEVGGSLSYLNPDRGLTVSVTARRLMAHQDDGYREWGIGGMIEYDPGAAGRGLSMRMVSSLGTAPSGTNRFWSQSAAGLNRNGFAGMDAPLTAEVDYRMRALGGRLLMAPMPTCRWWVPVSEARAICWDGVCRSDPTSACNSRWISATAPTILSIETVSWDLTPCSAARGWRRGRPAVPGDGP